MISGALERPQQPPFAFCSQRITHADLRPPLHRIAPQLRSQVSLRAPHCSALHAASPLGCPQLQCAQSGKVPWHLLVPTVLLFSPLHCFHTLSLPSPFPSFPPFLSRHPSVSLSLSRLRHLHSFASFSPRLTQSDSDLSIPQHRSAETLRAFHHSLFAIAPHGGF